MLERFGNAKQSFVLLNRSRYQSSMEASANAEAFCFGLRTYEAAKPTQTALGLAAAAVRTNGHPPWPTYNF
jgi:hypothetical protein